MKVHACQVTSNLAVVHVLRLRHHLCSDLADYSANGLCEQHSDILHVPPHRLLFLLNPQLSQIIEGVNICGTVTDLFLSSYEVFVAFHYKSGHLEIHNTVLALHGQIARILKNYCRHPWIVREAMTSAGFPTNLHTVEGSVCIESLAQTQACMSLVHKGKVVMLLDILEVLFCYFPDMVTPNRYGIVLGNSRDNFILLSLVLNYRLFYLVCIFKLFPPHRIPGCSNDGQGVYFGGGATYMLTDRHHGCVTYFGVALLLNLALLRHWDVAP